MSDHTPLKRCTQCGESKPATTEYFYRDKSNKAGLTPQCKACRRAYWSARAAEFAEKRRIKDAGHHAEIYARRKAREAGRPDFAARKRAYREANRERRNAYERKRYARKSQEIRQRQRKWRLAKIDQYKAAEQRYREANRQKLRERARQWYRDHSEVQRWRNKRNYRNRIDRYRKASVVSSRARTARKARLPTEYGTDDWQSCLEYFGGCCAACNRPPGLFHALALDHWVPLSAPDCPGHIATNIVPLCHGEGGCNNSKSNRDAVEWATERFGRRKAHQIITRVQDYFDSIRE